MRILAQRSGPARVDVEGETIGAIDRGLVLLVSIGRGDDDAILQPMALKVVHLRIFPDDEGRMNRSILEAGGSILAISQFTLHADCRRGRRPSFVAAAPAETGARLFDGFVDALRSGGVTVETGRFGANMSVHLVNEGPVTIWLDSVDVLAPVADG